MRNHFVEIMDGLDLNWCELSCSCICLNFSLSLLICKGKGSSTLVKTKRECQIWQSEERKVNITGIPFSAQSLYLASAGAVSVAGWWYQKYYPSHLQKQIPSPPGGVQATCLQPALAGSSWTVKGMCKLERCEKKTKALKRIHEYISFSQYMFFTYSLMSMLHQSLI